MNPKLIDKLNAKADQSIENNINYYKEEFEKARDALDRKLCSPKLTCYHNWVKYDYGDSPSFYTPYIAMLMFDDLNHSTRYECTKCKAYEYVDDSGFEDEDS